MSTRPPRDIPGATPTGRDRLLEPGWRYVEHTSMEDFRAEDWATLNAQRERYRAGTLADQVLRLLAASENDATFGYQVNNYHHSLQTAALAYRDGCDEQTVVMSLLHDIGFTLCPEQHAAFACAVIGPYLSEKNEWIVLNHPVFQAHHIHGYPGIDSDARETWRGHPWFDDAARWVQRYDICSLDPDAPSPPLAFFEPMVQRFFAQPPRKR